MTIEQILRRAGSQPALNRPPAIPQPPRRLHFPAPRRGGVLTWARTHPWLAGFAVYAFWVSAWAVHLWNVYAQSQLDATLGG